MSKLDWSKDRTRRQTMTAAANRLPGLINASYDGTCPECNRAYHRGDKITRVREGWGHPFCSTK